MCAVSVCQRGRHVRAVEHVDNIFTGQHSELDKLMQALSSETRLDVCENLYDTLKAAKLLEKDSTVGMPSTLTLESFDQRWHVLHMESSPVVLGTSCDPWDLQCVLFSINEKASASPRFGLISGSDMTGWEQ